MLGVKKRRNRKAKNHKCKRRDLTLLKLCFCSAGVLIGLAVPEEKREKVTFGAMTLFILTYIPTILRFLRRFSCEE